MGLGELCWYNLKHSTMEPLYCGHLGDLSIWRRSEACDNRLKTYTNSCNIADQTVLHEGTFWVGYDNASGDLILQYVTIHTGCI